MPIKKVILLLSGGIDSPVAGYEMIKAGVEVVAVHFFNTPQGIETKILKIAEVLSKKQQEIQKGSGKKQIKLKIHIVPFREAQLEIIKTVPAEYRMIIYKRLMLKIAAEIAKKEKADGLVTGDSLGQVASQTLDNTVVIYSAVNQHESPILTPLLGSDKEEIVKIAKKIGTYELSIAPYLDCCSFVISQHPATRAKQDVVEGFEANLDLKKLIKDCLASAKAKFI